MKTKTLSLIETKTLGYPFEMNTKTKHSSYLMKQIKTRNTSLNVTLANKKYPNSQLWQIIIISVCLCAYETPPENQTKPNYTTTTTTYNIYKKPTTTTI